MSQWVKPNHNFVPEYQASGLPFVTSSNLSGEVASAGNPIKIDFPGITRWFEVHNHGTGNLRVGFTELGVKGQGAVSGSNPVDGYDFAPRTGATYPKQQQANHNNFFVVPASGSFQTRWELKTDQIWISHHSDGNTDFSVIAGITNIPVQNFLPLTGSVGIRGVG